MKSCMCACNPSIAGWESGYQELTAQLALQNLDCFSGSEKTFLKKIAWRAIKEDAVLMPAHTHRHKHTPHTRMPRIYYCMLYDYNWYREYEPVAVVYCQVLCIVHIEHILRKRRVWKTTRNDLREDSVWQRLSVARSPGTADMSRSSERGAVLINTAQGGGKSAQPLKTCIKCAKGSFRVTDLV